MTVCEPSFIAEKNPLMLSACKACAAAALSVLLLLVFSVAVADAAFPIVTEAASPSVADAASPSVTDVPLGKEDRSKPTTAASLFCYMVVSDAEVPLLRVHHETRSGIFGCGEWAIFTNASSISGLLRDPRRVIHLFNGSMDVPTGGDFNSSLNAPLFQRVWPRLPALLTSLEGRNAGTLQWVIKADADTCFRAADLAELLRRRVQPGERHGGGPFGMIRAQPIDPLTYELALGLIWSYARSGIFGHEGFDIGGPNGGEPWIPGPLEVLSRAGALKLVDSLDVCEAALSQDLSEDIWLMKCLNGLVRLAKNNSTHVPRATPRMKVFTAANWLCWGWLGWAEDCNPDHSTPFVAWHPFKRPAGLRKCYDAAQVSGREATVFFNEHLRTLRAAATHDEAVQSLTNLQLSSGLAAATITECVIESVSGSGAALDPATVALSIPLTLVASLPCFERLQPSADDGTVLLLAFSSNAEVEQAIGLAAWPAPTRKEPSRVLRVSLPPEAAAAASAFERTKVRGLNATGQPHRRAANFLRFDTETKTLTLRLTIAAVRNTTNLGGAAVGAPPDEGGRWKFSLLERRWVRREAPLAAPKTLLTTHACDAVTKEYC